MKIISWNINGLNNILSKSKDGKKHQAHIEANGLSTLADEVSPDIICLQEVRCNTATQFLSTRFQQIYPHIYVNCAKNKKGYSGTAILSKIKPLNVWYDMHGVHEDEDLNDEGRIIRLQFKDFTLINVYTPNSKPNLERLDYRRQKWEPSFRDVVDSHNNKVIVCGDLNVAHNEIDLHSPHTNRQHAGFTEHERLAFGLLLHNHQMIDAFRFMRPSETKYSWWSNFHNSREKNKGWRIDYFVITRDLVKKLVDSDILTQYYGSDHAPVLLDLR